MFIFLYQFSRSVEYSISVSDLTISGEGIITRGGVRSKGSYSSIQKVIINEGPNKIDDFSFEECRNIQYIYIPKSIHEIGNYAFRFCDALKTIEVSSDSDHFCNDKQHILFSKDKKVMYRAPIKKNLTIPSSVESLVINTFTTGYFGYVVIPNTVINLWGQTFDCAHFNSLSFESGSKLKTINCFRYLRADKLILPSSLESIEGSTFTGAQIGTLEFGENSQLNTLTNFSFSGLEIEEIRLPNLVKVIKDDAFSGSSVKRIYIGSECSTISINAFSSCNKLTQVVVDPLNQHYNSHDGILMNKNKDKIIFVPNGKETIEVLSKVTEIGLTALQNSKLLKSVTFETGESDIWSTENGILYSKSFDKLIAICGGITTATINSNVIEIGKSAAFGCSNLKTISLPNSKVVTIGKSAFSDSGITSFELPQTVTTICETAFSGTKSLKTFTIGQDSLLETIGSYCFADSVIESFDFRKNVKIIDTAAFIECNSLKTVTFDTNIDFTRLGQVLFSHAGIESLLLPVNLINIPNRCFESCHNLTKVNFQPNAKLNTIGERAFIYCLKLEEVNLPVSCTEIAGESFLDCKLLSKFTHNLEKIKNNAFQGCTSLQSFAFSSRQVKEGLNPNIFMQCSNLETFTIDTSNNELSVTNGMLFNKETTVLIIFPPGRETAIIPPETLEFAELAFAFSSKVKFVAFYSGSNLTTIGNDAFYQCVYLEVIRFPPKLNQIGKNAFFGCASLGSVNLPDSITSIGEKAFIGCKKISVKYCGTNFLDNQNVFDENLEVVVTDLYEKDTFCKRKAAKKLSYNCELKPEFIKLTCKYIFGRDLTFTSLITLFVVNI